MHSSMKALSQRRRRLEMCLVPAQFLLGNKNDGRIDLFDGSQKMKEKMKKGHEGPTGLPDGRSIPGHLELQ